MKIQEISASHRKVVGRKVWHYDVVESTNETAKELLGAEIPEGLVVWADRQASGKGRHGRAWASPPGGLYLSIILRPGGIRAQVLGLLMGLPVVKALRHFGLFAVLKWPNDVVFQGRKIAGILSEGVYRREVYHVIVGLGVNTNVDLERLPPGVRERATSLKHEIPLFVSNEEFLDYLLDQADDLYSRYQHTPASLLMKEYRGHCETIGKRVAVGSGKGVVEGRALDVTSSGALVVMDDGGVRREIADGSVEYLS